MGDGGLQSRHGSGHLSGSDDALRAGLFANDLQQLAAVDLQHDDVGGGLGFEFVEHHFSFFVVE